MHKNLTMKYLHEQLDKILEVNGYSVFSSYTDYIKDTSMRHAEVEYNRFRDIQKLEMLGIDVDIVEYELGAYKDFQSEIYAITTHQLNNHFQKLGSLQ